MPRLVCLLPLVVFICSSAHAGESKRRIPAVRTSAPPIIDGRLDDPCWASAAKAVGFTDFITGRLVEDQTTVSLLYDEKFIYLGFDCRDSQPGTITARETVRDSKFQNSNSNGPNNTEDNVEVDLDPFLTHSGRDISKFSVNAIGTLSASIAGGRGSKAEWKGDWDAAVQRTPNGWVCEMRIPWVSFHFPSDHKRATLGINFSRYINRTRTTQEWSSTGPQGFTENEGLWIDVELPKQVFKRSLSLLPYVLGGMRAGRPGGKVGLDGRYTITPQLTAVGTLNPDYSNIEGAIVSAAFSHTPRSVPETRPFFTEGGQSFGDQTNINDIGAFFYSPAIKRFDTGAKVYGNLTPQDTIGALNTWTIGDRTDTVARWVHTIDPTTSAGAMVVDSRSSAVSSTVGAIDDHFRRGKLAFESIVAGSQGPGACGGAEVFSTYYADKVATSMIQFSGISNNFIAPDGYFPFTGYRGFVGVEDLAFNWRHGFWRSAEFTAVPLWWDQVDGSPYYRGIQLAYNMVTRSDWYFEVDYSRLDFQGVPDNFGNLQITRGITNRFCQMGLQLSAGVQGGAQTTIVGPTASFRVLKKLDLQYTGLVQNRLGQIQQHILTANYEISPTRSFGGRIVTLNADTNAFFYYHNSGGKGTEYYVLYGDPDAMRTVNSLQLKVVFSF